MDRSAQIQEIKTRMATLESLIEQTKARLPAHSTKPPVMMDLLQYEDEYDVLLKKLNEIKSA
ncbi:MAG: hypothetical protein KKE62_13470 [Proteobacteria bacterium]|nr:hypothetical protein [Pseudomonadota bacterium]MBU1389831.1 hypothetical protein [Pseudomonadota bacterium]MBU1543840.1 hypothetical protein [Pseudomonadota bacterium]MBU2481123.1 hypothetical protein [Pseudomonadota bacterium]